MPRTPPITLDGRRLEGAAPIGKPASPVRHTAGRASNPHKVRATTDCTTGKAHYGGSGVPYAIIASPMHKVLRRASAAIFFLAEKFGVHLTPNHYYAPISDFTWLRENGPLWEKACPLPGVRWDLDAQLASLSSICAEHLHEVAGLKLYAELTSGRWGQGYSPIESQVLHCFLRKHRPKRIVEIGSGVSTACMLHARERNEAPFELTCIEPFPRDVLRESVGTCLIEKPCQAVPLSVFSDLQEGDLLFIDSSHTLKIGSELPRIYLEIIPSLRPGVFIHIHDIYLPYLYPPDILTWPFWAWQETVLLAALLSGNRMLDVLFSLSALHFGRSAELRQVLPDYSPPQMRDGLAASSGPAYYPTSTWLRTTATA